MHEKVSTLAELSDDLPPPAEPKIELVIYRNYQGEIAFRWLHMAGIYWGANPYHTTPQHLMRAYCFDRKGWRDFAVYDMIFTGTFLPDGTFNDLLAEESVAWLTGQRDHIPLTQEGFCAAIVHYFGKRY